MNRAAPSRRGTTGRVSATTVTTVAAALAAVALVGVIDYATGYEIRLYPLYYVPIAATAWSASKPASLGMCVAGAATWAVSNWLAGSTYSHQSIWAVNVGVQFVGLAVVALLVSELRSRLQREESLSRQDALTGLLNRRAFRERAEMYARLSARSARPVTIAYVDLDHFKSVNDQRGHKEGDRALKRVAAVLEATLRGTDVLARMGGDEFAIVLYDADAEVAEQAYALFDRRVAHGHVGTVEVVRAAVAVVEHGMLDDPGA